MVIAKRRVRVIVTGSLANRMPCKKKPVGRPPHKRKKPVGRPRKGARIYSRSLPPPPTARSIYSY